MLEIKSVLLIMIGIILAFIGLYSKKINGNIWTISHSFSKRVNVPYFFIFLLFWFFAICLTDSYDISNYRYAYNERLSHGKEAFFDFLQFFFHDAGWSFDAFKFLWVTLVITLLYIAIKRYSNNPNAVVALALITPLTGFITQMRSALVSAIALNAFSLVLSGRRKDKIVYCTIIILSAQVHVIGYAFLIFLLVRPQKIKNFRSLYYVIIAVVTLAALFLPSIYMQTISIILNVLPILGNNMTRILSYFQGEGSHFRYAFFLACKHLFLFYLTDRACEIQMKKDEGIAAQRRGMIQQANMLMLFFLPITIMSASFERIFNCFTLIQYSMVFDSGRAKLFLFKRLFGRISLQSVLIIGVLFITIIELYFSPNDMVRIFNSIKWPF